MTTMSSNGDLPQAQAPAEPAPFDLGAKLSQRLREHTATRDRTQRRMETEAGQLQNLTKAAPKRPRESKTVLEQKAKRLERDRTTRSLPLAQEKAILRQIDAAKKGIRQHDQGDKHQILLRRKKAEVEASRAALRTINVTLSEIETALSKVELGKKLGCLPSEVICRDISCPMNKMNWAMGKNSENVKEIEDSVGVEIDVDKMRAKFTVRGSQVRVDEAVLRLEKFTKAVDEELRASSDVISYLLSQQSSVLNKIKENNPEVVIDLLATRFKMRGHPDKIQKVKDDIGGVQVFSKTRLLVGRETSHVVGKTGGTLHAFSEKYGVVMDVSKKDGDKTTLRVIGPSENVDAALAEVDKLLVENEEIEESIVVDPLLKSELLNNSGANIKEFQRSVSSAVEAGHPEAGGVLLSFGRNGSKEENPTLILKCSRCAMDRAKSLVTKKVEQFESNVISIDVPEEMISAIIGKGGAVIGDLRHEGKGAVVETDANNKGAIKVYSSDSTTRDAIRQKIDQIIAENQTGSIPIEKGIIGFLLGDPGKDMRNACSELGCTLNMSTDDTELVIKGTNEKIKQASELLKDFLAKNFIAELDVASDEQPLLFMGGSDSILHQVENKHNVKASFRKSKNVLEARGEAGKVSAALDDIKCFLNGGDGVAVCKFKVDDKAKGGVIGRGGSNIAKLEDEFKGILIHVPKDNNTISIRGPEDLVEKCRIRLITTIATARVVENIDIDLSQHEKLSKSNIIKKISRLTNTQMTLNETSIRVRGMNDDVRYAKANIEENLTGVYHGYIHLEASQLSRVKSAVAKDPSHFQRIHASTGAEVIHESDAIHIFGKRSNVIEAKASVIADFLSFMLPRQLQTVKMHKTLLKSMGDPGRLAQIATETGASICLDRDINSVLIRSDDANICDKAVGLVNSMMVECQKLIVVMKFDSSDSWLMSVIVGKGGSSIKKLEKETECSFDIIKDERTVVILADSEKLVQAGQKALDNMILQARKECIFIYLPESALPAFIGRGGAGIKKIAADNDVQVDRTKTRPSTICIKGTESCVTNARNAVLSWVKAWEARHIGITIDLTEQQITSILGKGGETVRSIEKETGCNIDVDRQQLTLTVKYGKDANRDRAIEQIEAVIDGEATKGAEPTVGKAELIGEHAEIAIDKAEGTTETDSSSSYAPGDPSKEIVDPSEDIAGLDGVEVGGDDEEVAEAAEGAADEAKSKEEETGVATEEAESAETVEVNATGDESDKTVDHPVGQLLVTEKCDDDKEEGEYKPEINGTDEGRQLYQWLLTGHVGDAIADIVYPDSDSESSNDSDDECSDDDDLVVIKKNEKGEEVRYYESESGFSVRLPAE